MKNRLIILDVIMKKKYIRSYIIMSRDLNGMKVELFKDKILKEATWDL